MLLGLLAMVFPDSYRERYKPDVPMVAGCSGCKRLIVNRMCNRMVTHLIYDHKLEHNEAYQTVDHVFLQFSRYLRAKAGDRK
jgi:hypothetical protein